MYFMYIDPEESRWFPAPALTRISLHIRHEPFFCTPPGETLAFFSHRYPSEILLLEVVDWRSPSVRGHREDSVHGVRGDKVLGAL